MKNARKQRNRPRPNRLSRRARLHKLERLESRRMLAGDAGEMEPERLTQISVSAQGSGDWQLQTRRYTTNGFVVTNRMNQFTDVQESDSLSVDFSALPKEGFIQTIGSSQAEVMDIPEPETGFANAVSYGLIQSSASSERVIVSVASDAITNAIGEPFVQLTDSELATIADGNPVDRVVPQTLNSQINSEATIDSAIAWLPSEDLREEMWLSSHIYLDANSTDRASAYATVESGDLNFSLTSGAASYEFVPIRAGQQVTAVTRVSANTSQSAEFGLSYQATAGLDFWLQPFKQQVKSAEVSGDLQYVDVIYSSLIAPELFDNSMYWFSTGESFLEQSAIDTEQEFFAAYSSRTVAVTPDQFRDITPEPLGFLEGTEFFDSSPHFRLRIPTSIIADAPSNNSRLAFHLDSGTEDFFDGDVYEPYDRRFDNFFEIRPDAIVRELEWTEDGGVQGTYDILWVKDLSDPLELDLYWSADAEFDSADTPASNVTWLTQIEPGTGIPFDFSYGEIENAAESDRHLIAAIDSVPAIEGLLYEHREQNNHLPIPVSDIDASDAGFRVVGDGMGGQKVEFYYQYSVNSAGLPFESSAQFFWADAAGERLENVAVIPEAPIVSSVGDYEVTVDLQSFSERPDWATKIQITYDEPDDIREYSEDNNALLINALTDIRIQAAWWDDQIGGLHLRYAIVGPPPESKSEIEFFWQSTSTYSEAEARFAVASVVVGTDPGVYEVYTDGNRFEIPAADEIYLVLVADLNDEVEESDETNNQREVFLLQESPDYVVEVSPDPGLLKTAYEIQLSVKNRAPVPLDGYIIDWRDPNMDVEGTDVRIIRGRDGTIVLPALPPEERISFSLGTFERDWDWISKDNPTWDSTQLALANMFAAITGIPKGEFGLVSKSLRTAFKALDATLAITSSNAVLQQSSRINLEPTNTQGRWPGSSLTHDVNLRVGDKHQLNLAAHFIYKAIAGQTLGLAYRSLLTLNFGFAASFIALAVANYKIAEAAYDLAADPPDPDFETRVEPSFSEFTGVHDGLTGLALRRVRLTNQLVGFRLAQAAAQDKSDGALLAEDLHWRSIHQLDASRFAEDAFAAEQQLARLADNREDRIDQAFVSNEVMEKGFPPEFRESLESLGVSSSSIDDLKNQLIAAGQNDPVTVDFDRENVNFASLVNIAQSSIDHLSQGVELAVDSGQLTTDISSFDLAWVNETRAKLEADLDNPTRNKLQLWSENEAFRSRLREIAEQTLNFQAVAEHLDFSYGVAIGLTKSLPKIVPVDLGATGLGVAALDSAIGNGFIMYSEQLTQDRFGTLSTSSEHLVAVQLDGLQWTYSNNGRWQPFTPVDSDRLVSAIDFDAGTVALLNATDGEIHGIREGFFGGDLQVTANMWNGSPNSGEFGVSGSLLEVLPDNTQFIHLGPTRSGIAVLDTASGSGFLMYSEQPVQDRFNAISSNSLHLIAVQFNGESWTYSANGRWRPFVPRNSDRLIAEVNFEDDLATPIEGPEEVIHGIRKGFLSSEMIVKANHWNGAPNLGEFEVLGSYIQVAGSDFELTYTGPAKAGIAVYDRAIGTGFLMFSQQRVQDRFGALSSNNDHLIAVQFNGAEWTYSANSAWKTFVPEASDQLLASVDFDSDVIVNLDGQSGSEHGIRKGFYQSDLTFEANQWAGLPNDGEIGVSGLYFETRLNGIAVSQDPIVESQASARDARFSPLDANRDGQISPRDALVVVNALDRSLNTESELDSRLEAMDTNGDGKLSAVDALLVINHLSQISQDPEWSSLMLPFHDNSHHLDIETTDAREQELLEIKLFNEPQVLDGFETASIAKEGWHDQVDTLFTENGDASQQDTLSEESELDAVLALREL